MTPTNEPQIWMANEKSSPPAACSIMPEAVVFGCFFPEESSRNRTLYTVLQSIPLSMNNESEE